jgi:hypothetical protein
VLSSEAISLIEQYVSLQRTLSNKFKCYMTQRCHNVRRIHETRTGTSDGSSVCLHEVGVLQMCVKLWGCEVERSGMKWRPDAVFRTVKPSIRFT